MWIIVVAKVQSYFSFFYHNGFCPYLLILNFMVQESRSKNQEYLFVWKKLLLII